MQWQHGHDRVACRGVQHRRQHSALYRPMTVRELLACRKSELHFTRMRIYRDDLSAKKVRSRWHFLQVIRHLLAPAPAFRPSYISEPGDAAVEIVLVRSFDSSGDDLTDP